MEKVEERKGGREGGRERGRDREGGQSEQVCTRDHLPSSIPLSPPQALIAMPGVADRGLAVKMPIDRECIARYFIAAQWRPSLRGQPTVDCVLRTLKWREDERVAVLGPEDVLAQAWNGYLYVNGTDMIGQPMIYYRPAFQVRPCRLPLSLPPSLPLFLS